MYQPHSQTSRDAYHSLEGKETLCDRIYSAIENTGVNGTTNGWLCQRIKIQSGTMSARLIELQRAGRILKLKRTMENPSGVKANVYIAARYQGNLLPGDKIEMTKCDPQPHKDNKAARELLADVESHIVSGFVIAYGSPLHKKIEAFLNGKSGV